MLSKLTLAALLSAAVVAAQSDSEVVAVFMLGRHGDRTSKVQGNTLLTTLGKNQVFESAQYFHNRYLNSSSPDYIQGVNSSYLYSQIYAQAPNENVLGNTATAFLQGFYPPSPEASVSTLTNGTTESNPLDGYQYVLVNGITANAPDAIWIKGDQFCPAMTNASKAYYQSSEFLARQTQLQSFYDKFTPLLTGIFPQSAIGFQSAYGIFDYLNVGYVHNKTIFSNITSDDLFQLRTLADSQELALVYNASSPNTSIGGKTLSGAILTALNSTATGTNTKLKVSYYAASYSVFQAFWGISGLLQASPDFYGLPNYASTMSFELRRPANATGLNDLFVRYGFRNGSLPSAELVTFPMFGRSATDADMPWNTFMEAMGNQSITSQKDWCNACVSSNLTFCSAYTLKSTSGSAGANSIDDSGSCPSVSPVAAGFIGAGVTIAVIAAIEFVGALMWFRRRRSNTLAKEKSPGSEVASDRSILA